MKVSCTPAQRQHLVYLIAGQYHPDSSGLTAAGYISRIQDTLHEALDRTELRACKNGKPERNGLEDEDIVFYDQFIDEQMLLKLYGATNTMILPYLNMEQISSGVLGSSRLGSGRVGITTTSATRWS